MKNRQLIGFLVIAMLSVTACGKKEEVIEPYVQDIVEEEPTTEELEIEESSVEQIEEADDTEEDIVDAEPEDIISEDDNTEENMIPEISGTDYNWGPLEKYEDSVGGYPYVRYKSQYTDTSKDLESMSNTELLEHLYAVTQNAMIDEGCTLSEQIDTYTTTYQLDKNGVGVLITGDPDVIIFTDYIEGTRYTLTSGEKPQIYNGNMQLYMIDESLRFNPMNLEPMVRHIENNNINISVDAIDNNILEITLGDEVTFTVDKKSHRIKSWDSVSSSASINYGDVKAVDMTDIKEEAVPMYTDEEVQNMPQY